jgi:hypothetical protein
MTAQARHYIGSATRKNDNFLVKVALDRGA